MHYIVFDVQVQLLSDNQRGATLEAVVSRMKTIHSLSAAELKHTSPDCPGIRFIAVSATIPNVSDVRRLHFLCKSFLLHILPDTASVVTKVKQRFWYVDLSSGTVGQ